MLLTDAALMNAPHTRTVSLPPVVFDLDDVLGSFNMEMCRVLVDITGDPTVIDDHKSWDQYQIGPLYPQIKNFEDVFRKMEEEGFIANLPVIVESRHLCNAFYNLGHKIVILTARGWMKDPRVITSKWLQQNGILYDELIIVDPRVSKKDFMPANTSCYFDDHPQHILDCAPIVERAYLVSRPWNALTQGLPNNTLRMDINQLQAYGNSLNVLKFYLDRSPSTREQFYGGVV